MMSVFIPDIREGENRVISSLNENRRWFFHAAALSCFCTGAYLRKHGKQIHWAPQRYNSASGGSLKTFANVFQLIKRREPSDPLGAAKRAAECLTS